MSLRSLQVVLRSLADATPPASDGELLRQFLGGDAEAFAELIRRHGRLVWAVCRHLTGSDAEADDAFQATFLVLLRGAGKVRDAGKLSAWLHGVAYKVCAKARRTTQRRATRERVVAARERNGTAVPDSAWDRALAAVHEEVGALPEALRVPFVLCCLEGKGVTEAAAQLGWKLGTVSGRLARAKDAVLARLDARGLTLGAVAGLGLVAPPTTAMAKASALARAGFAVPNSVLQLTQGVIGMSATSFKVLAAAVLLTAGLGVVGHGWVATADAQPPGKPAGAKPDPDAEVRRLQALLEQARAEAAAKQAQAVQRGEARMLAEMLAVVGQQQRTGETYTAKTEKWEYDFVVLSEMGTTKFVAFLQDRETRGWEYNGTTTLTHEGKPTSIWVFRRPVRTAETKVQNVWGHLDRDTVSNSATFSFTQQPKPDDAKAIEAEIARLQKRLAELKANPLQKANPAPQLNPALKADPPVKIPVFVRDAGQTLKVPVVVKEAVAGVVVPKDSLPLDPEETAAVLTKLAGKRFKAGQFKFTPTSSSVMVEGDKEVIDWAAAMLKKLGEK